MKNPTAVEIYADKPASRRAGFPEEQAISFLFLDLDRFKMINNNIGHAAGDAVLCETTRWRSGRQEGKNGAGSSGEKSGGGTTGMLNEPDRGAASSILLVEDDPLGQKVGKAMLAHFGARVDVAGNGREAVEALSRQRYDMIFMDCQMPEMDGYEATGVIREREAHERGGGDRASRIPIVALTGRATDADRERCLRAGMDDYLSKPFSVAGVRTILDRWLPNRQTPATEAKVGAGSPGVDAPAGTAGETAGQEVPPVIDRKSLAAIAALQPPGGEDILKKVIALYLDSSLKLIQGIREAAKGNDADALYRAAHTLKSSSAYLGALTFSGMCKELEMMGRGNTLSGVAARLAALEKEYARVRETLGRFLGGVAAADPDSL